MFKHEKNDFMVGDTLYRHGSTPDRDQPVKKGRLTATSTKNTEPKEMTRIDAIAILLKMTDLAYTKEIWDGIVGEFVDEFGFLPSIYDILGKLGISQKESLEAEKSIGTVRVDLGSSK